MWIGICALIVYCIIDAVEIMDIYEVDDMLYFVRAVAIVVFLLIGMYRFNGLWTKRIHDLMIDCSKFSLQLYLFNGYLLTFFRVIICSVLHISSPFLIAFGIWAGDIAVTLFLCKWIIPKVSILGFCCGIEGQMH